MLLIVVYLSGSEVGGGWPVRLVNLMRDLIPELIGRFAGRVKRFPLRNLLLLQRSHVWRCRYSEA